MAFEGLANKLQETMRKLRGSARVTEKDVKDMMREVKLALLEADVNFKVVKEFVGKVSERAVGSDVLESLTPGQQVVKIVNEELVALMGGEAAKVGFSSSPPTVFMMVGLQGSGKTTSSGKLANFLRKQGKNPLLAACDIYRPAAIKQLQVVGNQLNVPVFTIDGCKDAVEIASKAVKHAQSMQHDLLIIDTAGRLHIDEELMDELKRIKSAVNPTEILLVVDSMTGQDAVNVAESFHEMLDISGVVLTKLDGDTRGGAALSVRAVTGRPIKFAATGEKLSDIEIFYPDRMASRILGMGDVLSLIEKAQEAFDEKQALELEKKMRTNSFTIEDYLEQMQQMKSIGGIGEMLKMMPGAGAKGLGNLDVDEKMLDKTEAIIYSMTKKERLHPEIINASRRIRIAKGCGMQVSDVNKFLKSFDEMKKLMKQMSGGGKKGRKGFGNLKLPF